VTMTNQEKDELKNYILNRTCSEHRRGKPCIDRNNSKMIGDLHAGCHYAERLLTLVDAA
jgi:hypothetical protein